MAGHLRWARVNQRLLPSGIKTFGRCFKLFYLKFPHLRNATMSSQCIFYSFANLMPLPDYNNKTSSLNTLKELLNILPLSEQKEPCNDVTHLLTSGFSEEAHYEPQSVSFNDILTFQECIKKNLLQCSADSKKCIKMLRLSNTSLWYPWHAVRRNEEILCSIAFSEVECKALESNMATKKVFSENAQQNNVTNNICDLDTLLMSSTNEVTSTLLAQNQNKGSSSSNIEPSGRPNAEQLSRIFDRLGNDLPNLFIKPMDYTVYSPNIIFENRIRGTNTMGIYPYIRQIAVLRIVGHLKFSFIKFEVLKMTKHPEDGTVRVRWRILGVSGLKTMVQFWKLKLWQWKETKKEMTQSWYDGFSTFHVGSDGKVYKHVADNMMPDHEREVAKVSLSAKVAAMLGILPKPSYANSSSSQIESSNASNTVKEHFEICSIAMLPLEEIE